ncbi:DUF262 domain-containing protein [Aquipuribacter hungaricus]|uniref:DUF262 domain-containing protein n=1 Tax=Aquipuribacter hungaricus TaxID=545624 RepID=UPI0030EE38E9
MADVQEMQSQLEDQRRKVDVDVYTITVRELLAMADAGELHRAPEYQRKFRWNEEAESRLIESLLLGLPVPNLFFATNADGTWEVVDGLQRISTLIHFASKSAKQMQEIKKDAPLALTGLRKLSEFNGLTFDALPAPIRMNFTKRGVGVTALSDKSDPQTRFDTFERLNRGAVALSDQEVRACIYEGPFNSLLRELALTEKFSALLKLQEADENNATREELVLKFFAYLNNRTAFRGAVGKFLNDYMEANQTSFDVDSGRSQFLQVVEELARVVGGRFLRVNTNVTPKNELEAAMVAAAEVLATAGTLVNPGPRWLDDRPLVDASTGATNTARKLNDRINRAKDLLSGSVQADLA